MREMEPPARPPRDILGPLIDHIRSLGADRKDIISLARRAEAEFLRNSRDAIFDYENSHVLPSGTNRNFHSLVWSHFRGHERSLYEDLKRHKCAYCEIKSATTIDHYREKSTSPLLVVTVENLIPACDSCNTRFRGAADGDKFHPYYDRISHLPWIHVGVTFRKDLPLGCTFSVSKVAFDDEKLFHRVDKTFHVAEIGEVFTGNATMVISLWSRLLQTVPPYHRGSYLQDAATGAQEAHVKALLLRLSEIDEWHASIPYDPSPWTH